MTNSTLSVAPSSSSSSSLGYVSYPDGSFGFHVPNITVEKLDLIRRSNRTLDKSSHKKPFTTTSASASSLSSSSTTNITDQGHIFPLLSLLRS